MPRIETSVLVSAPVDVVFAVARDVEAFPGFMDDLESLKLLESHDGGTRTLTEWVGVIREFKMNIKWIQEDVWDPEKHRDDFRMLSGDMDAMAGYWQFDEVDGGTQFSSVLDYEYNVPLIGPMVKALIKKKMTANLEAQLAAIKARAEAAAAG